MFLLYVIPAVPNFLAMDFSVLLFVACFAQVSVLYNFLPSLSHRVTRTFCTLGCFVECPVSSVNQIALLTYNLSFLSNLFGTWFDLQLFSTFKSSQFYSHLSAL